MTHEGNNTHILIANVGGNKYTISYMVTKKLKALSFSYGEYVKYLENDFTLTVSDFNPEHNRIKLNISPRCPSSLSQDELLSLIAEMI